MLTLNECTYSYLESNFSSGLLYLSNEDQIAVHVKVLPSMVYSTDDKLQLSWTQLTAQMRNADAINAHVTNFSVSEYGPSSRQIELALSPRPFTVRPTF